MKAKLLGVLAILMISVFAIAGISSALPEVEFVKINGEYYEYGDDLAVKLGETVEVKVRLTAYEDEEDLELQADILGYEYNDKERISDVSQTFDMDAGETQYETLEIKIPEKLDKDEYDLRLRVGTRRDYAYEGLFRLSVKGERHSLQIKDVVFSPENRVKSGRTLTSIVRIKNIGEKDEEGVKVQVAIPALGLSQSDYIDELDADETTTSKELYLRIPECIDDGAYTAKVTVEFDEGYETVSQEQTIVIDSDECSPVSSASASAETVIAIGSESQDVAIGEAGAVYPLTISNTGKTSKTYSVLVDGASDWANIKVSPSSTVVLNSGEAKVVYVYVSAKEDASEGAHMFSATVSSGGEALKQITFKSNVTEGTSAMSKVRQGLQVGLFVLVVLLVILGLIILFNKLRGDDDEDELDEEGQTYY